MNIFSPEVPISRMSVVSPEYLEAIYTKTQKSI